MVLLHSQSSGPNSLYIPAFVASPSSVLLFDKLSLCGYVFPKLLSMNELISKVDMLTIQYANNPSINILNWQTYVCGILNILTCAVGLLEGRDSH